MEKFTDLEVGNCIICGCLIQVPCALKDHPNWCTVCYLRMLHEREVDRQAIHPVQQLSLRFFPKIQPKN
jgi:hypothetical protein